MTAVFLAVAFVLVATFVLGYAVRLVSEPEEPAYVPRHAAGRPITEQSDTERRISLPRHRLVESAGVAA